MGAIIGIDFGTTTSKMAHLQEGKPQPVINKKSASELTPSLVGLNENVNELKVGKTAERLSSSVISEIKRRMGEARVLKLGDNEYQPEEIAAMIFKHLKEYGEDYLDDEIKDVVVSVPVYFNEAAVLATQRAAELAGLNVLRIIQEPVAAAIAFGYGKDYLNKNILVYDFGGGTFNVSIVNFTKEGASIIESTEVNYLGGAIFDQRLIRLIKEHLRDEFGVDSADDNLELKIREEAKKTKELFSKGEIENVVVSFIAIYEGKLINFKMILTKEKLELLTEDLVNETIITMDSLFEKGKVSKEEIDWVILAGGSTRMPFIKDKVTSYFGIPPMSDVEPDLAVSFGAAMLAGIIKAGGDIAWI